MRRLFLLLASVLLSCSLSWAQEATNQTIQAQEKPQDGNKGYVSQATAIPPAPQAVEVPAQQPSLVRAPETSKNNVLSDTKYTLGPDDVITVTVARHTEFSGTFPVNQEGKIQIPFVGDVDVNGLTKKELEAKLAQALSTYVVNPEVSVTITVYQSKVIYVIGEVGIPGRFYMRSESIPVREAIVQAGLPTIAAAMRKCRVISPAQNGKVKTRTVDLYALLYGGDLRKNIEMKPGDILYVPATVMAKVFRTIAPITAPVTEAATASTGAQVLRRPSATAPDAGD